MESAKSYAWRVCVHTCFACSRAWSAYVLASLICLCDCKLGVLACLPTLKAYMAACLACLLNSNDLRTDVLTCLICLFVLFTLNFNS